MFDNTSPPRRRAAAVSSQDVSIPRMSMVPPVLPHHEMKGARYDRRDLQEFGNVDQCTEPAGSVGSVGARQRRFTVTRDAARGAHRRQTQRPSTCRLDHETVIAGGEVARIDPEREAPPAPFSELR